LPDLCWNARVIHATAIVHPHAVLDVSVTVGPYAVIDDGVMVGSGCVIGPHVHLTGHTQIGPNNTFHTGCVIGDAPQDLKYKNEPTRLVIGTGNVFREHVTVHRSNKLSEDTVIGSHNFLMANSHVGHNTRLGNHVILANGALLGGHVEVGDRAFISGNCLVHQFCRVGTLALMQGGSAVSVDLPPFTIVHEVNRLCGLNIIGLRRAGLSAAERLELKKLYHRVFRSGGNVRATIAAAQKEFTSAPAKTMLEFLVATKRGVCADTGSRADEVED
jgi:UDP-N-acetylglucosamine acyltransferase